jgi:hypothetical protein
MPKFEIKATELTDTDVNFVALVKRGANRLPFRITKGDTADMIDLHKIGRQLFKKADPAPAVVAIVTQKADIDPTLIDAVREAVGLTSELVKSDKDGIVTLAKADAPTEGLFLLKLDEDVALAVAHSSLSKAFSGYDFSSTSFKDVVGTNGFCDGIGLASNALDDTIANILYQAEDPATARDLINKAVDDFKAYVDALTGSIPVQAFKADVALIKAAKAKASNAAGGTDDDQETGDGQGDQANGGKKTTMKSASTVAGNEDEALDKQGAVDAKKGDAGKNGTGAGVAQPSGNGTTPRATADDDQNTEVNAKPGGKVSGSSSGTPSQVAAKKGVPVDPDRDGDDDTVMTGESQAGEGAADPMDRSGEARASADDSAHAGGAVTGKVKGKTLDMSGIPAGAQSPTQKNDGDADIGKKGKGKTLPDDQSGAGAQEKDVQTYKSDDPVMQAVQALAKSVQESLAVVSKSVEALNARVEGVATMAKKTDAALNGTVFNETDADRVPAIKSDRTGGLPLLDTAYSRRGAA